MFHKASFLFVLLIMVLFLPACDLVKNISQGEPAPGECPYGTWQLKGGEAFLRATIPVGALDQTELTFTGGGGAVFYNFKDDGSLIVTAPSLLGRFDAKLEQTVSSLIISMQGMASAEYKLKDGKIDVGETIDNQITYRATLDDEDMVTSVQAPNFLPLFVEPYRSAEFLCEGESLFLTIVDLPGDIPPIEFVRLKPTPTP